MIPVVDGHNDSLLRIRLEGGSLLERAETGHLDVPRAREGGIAAGFCAVFAPAWDERPDDVRALAVPTADGYEVPLEKPIEFERADRIARELADSLLALEGEELRVVRGIGDLEGSLAGGPFGAILHLEGAEPIKPGLGNLEAWVERGLRSVGIVWSRPNAFGSGVPFRFPGSPDVGPGLTAAGRELVRACNRLGVMVDLAHLNAAGFDEVARLSTAPLVSTHTGAHALCPVPRSLVDAQLDAIGDSGGLVGIVFDTAMTRADGMLDPDTPLDVVLGHVEYVAGRLGVEHVALGSDFDGAHPPRALADATKVPALLDGLAARGWRDGDLRALAHGNWLRVLRATWQD